MGFDAVKRLLLCRIESRPPKLDLASYPYLPRANVEAAKFPATKSLDSFDFKARPKHNKMQVLELARCEWILRRENVIMPEACLRNDALGPSGTGKTHVALGLALAACQKGMSVVSFTTAAALANELMEARDERRLIRLQKHLIWPSVQAPRLTQRKHTSKNQRDQIALVQVVTNPSYCIWPIDQNNVSPELSSVPSLSVTTQPSPAESIAKPSTLSST